jgi:hypothetical protein
MLTAGFACGLALLRGAAVGRGAVYILPSGTAAFHPLLGRTEILWLCSVIVGLSFAAVAKRLRFGDPMRSAEWLAVSLAIMLVDFAFPAFRPERAASREEELVFVDWFGDGVPLAYHLWTPARGESIEMLAAIAIQTSIAAAVVGVAAWVLREKLSHGSIAVLVIVIAILFTLGPIRLAEAMSSEVASSRHYAGIQPPTPRAVWSRLGLSLYLDARAWAGYSPRAFWLITLAIATRSSFVHRRHHWLWIEWVAFAIAVGLAACWAYDEFYSRPAYDRPARVIGLAVWLLLLALQGGIVFALFTPARIDAPAAVSPLA